MNAQKNSDDIASFLNCLGILELTNSELFEELSNRTTVTEVKTPLMEISKGNKTESELLLSLGNKLGCTEYNRDSCKRKIKPVCDVVDSALKKVKKKKQITAIELYDFLVTLEQNGGPMQFLQIQAETFMFMAKQISEMYKMDRETFNKHIEKIAQQVEDHIEILEQVKAKLVQLTTEQKDRTNHPAFKYQRPDAWYTPKVRQ